MAGDAYIECGTHGTKPWRMECMCKACGRIYRPRQDDQSIRDGPFVELENWGVKAHVMQLRCCCGEPMLQFSGDDVTLFEVFAQICPKCFKRDFKFAKRQGIDVNDDKMCRDRLARRSARGHN